MKKSICFLLLLLPGIMAVHAQQVPEKLKYQLAESILQELSSNFVYAKRSPDGRYYRQPPMATDTPVVRLLLLDHASSTDADYQIVLASEGTSEHAQAIKYFSSADVAYMCTQLPADKLFKFEQAKIRESWVTVIPLDTITAIDQRLGWRARFLARDSLFQRYGSDKTFTIWGFLFSKNHKRALVNVGTGDGWETCVYTKAGTAWHKEATLYMVDY
ncbi:hypothetical protein [Hymenobacter sp. PAMC 26628]|uniref:hypothetical protein n=1 Tax=Hymenobacter sp. PAMC 26628 TaxID=1484118 RepID=UPI0007705A2B|nr:hypothetical protein [Hymenobacter sp. PAMC 26628]AMJ66976.1 hypothetical protein AXW84_17215 [Hymenobacter sp. PAMC 26628]